MSRLAGLALAAVVVIACLTAAMPAPASQEMAARQELRQRLAELLNQQQELQATAADLAAQLASAKERQAADIALLADLRQKQADEARRLVELGHEMERQNALLAKGRSLHGLRLRALYLFGADASLHLLASARGFSDALERSRAMTAVVEADQRRLEILAMQTAGLARLSAELKLRQAQHEQTRRQVEAGLVGLAQSQQRVSGLLVQLPAEEKRLATVIASVKEAELRLVRTFALDQRYDPAEAPGVVAGQRAAQPVEAMASDSVGSRGVTFKARKGAQVRAPWEGAVAFAAAVSGWGKVVVLDHGQRVHTVLALLDTLSVDVGQRVTAGQVVGAVGGGGRLYLEVRKNAKPVNSLQWLRLAP